MLAQLTDIDPVDGGVYFAAGWRWSPATTRARTDRGRGRQHRGRRADLPVHEVRAGHGARYARLIPTSPPLRRPGAADESVPGAGIWGVRSAAGRLAWLPTRPRAGRARTLQRLTESCFVANIKSQIKRIRTNEIARQRNKQVKSRAEDRGAPLPRGCRRRQQGRGARRVLHGARASWTRPPARASSTRTRRPTARRRWRTAPTRSERLTFGRSGHTARVPLRRTRASCCLGP